MMKILKKIWEVQGVVKVTLHTVEFMIIRLCIMIKTEMKDVFTL